MTLTCGSCGKPFEAKRAAAKFCGATCRKRAERAPRVSEAEPQRAGVSGLMRATRETLEAAGVLDTVAGQQAVLLSERMSSPFETCAAVAAMGKLLSVVVADALKTVQASDPLDELRRRRDAKRAGGGSR